MQNKLFTDLEVTVTPCIRIAKTDRKSLANDLLQFLEYGTQIVILFVSNEMKCLILHEAIEMGITWPKYALIAFHYTRECLTKTEGVITFDVLKHDTGISEQNFTLGMSKYLDHYDVHSSTIHDSIMAVASARKNTFANLSFEGVTGTLIFRKKQTLDRGQYYSGTKWQ